MFARMKFSTKVFLGSLGAVALTVALMAAVNVWMVTGELQTLGRYSLASTADNLMNTLQMQNDVNQAKLDVDLALMEQTLAQYGNLFLDESNTIEMTITNQVTKKSEQVEMPTLSLASYRGTKTVTGNFEVVDRVQDMAGGTATIFQVLPGKLLRVSTNVRKLDGSRAVGTYIPSESPVYKTVMAGETFRGKAFVVNAWYQTAYKPVADEQGKIIAVIYVGRLLMSPEMREMLGQIDVSGAGYASVYNGKDEFLHHPTIEGQTLEQAGLENLSGIQDDFASYTFQGRERVARIKYFEPWDWHVMVSLTTDEMLHGMDRQVLTGSLVVAGVALVLAAGVVFLLVRAISAPLRRLSDYTEDVAKGNYDASICYEVQDAIGQTVSGVCTMVDEIKEKLGFSEGILRGMTVPCLVADTEERLTFVNQPTLDLLGYKDTPEDHLGDKVGEFFYGDKSRKTITGQVVREQQAVTGVELELTNRRGEAVHAKLDVAPLFDLDRQLIGAFAVITDLTDIKEQQARIERQNEVIAQAARDADAIASTVSSAAEELSAQIDQSTRGAEMQKERASETATAMEEMNATVLEVAQNASNAAERAEQARERAESGAEVVRRVIAATNEVAEQTRFLSSNMAELGEQTENIGQIMNVINDIADQTNLLALNAAIEAARAGEAGRGFAVVADEVRKLAEKTMAATKEVGEAIGAIQEGARRNVEATEKAAASVEESAGLADESGHALEEIVRIAVDTADQVRSIAAAAEQQSAASDEISRASEDVNRISMETAQAMSQSAGAVADLAEQAQELQKVIERMTK